MTKTGKPDSYWRDICIKYAQGKYQFSTGKRPGAKKWKKALEKIDACPLQSHSATKDLFGRSLQCSCGFHKFFIRSSINAISGPSFSLHFIFIRSSINATSGPSFSLHFTATPHCYSNQLERFRKVIHEADQVWVAKCLYEPTGQLRQKLHACWFYPPLMPKPSPPEPGWYSRQRLFIWAPMRTWGISLKCPQCSLRMNSSGIYRKVREVIDVDSRYCLVGGDYPRCSKCAPPVCPWSQEILSQVDVAHRSLFPSVLMTQLALDRRCMTFLKPRTSGNSSSYMQSAIEEAHSEEWTRQTIRYLSDCEHHMKMATFVPSAAVYPPPPPFRPLPLAQWFETVHSNDILSHVDEMKGVITSTYGRILKMDSTKKITKKLAGVIGDSAAWMTNIGVSSVAKLFHPWKSTVRLDSGIFEWDQKDVQRLKEAKRGEWRNSHSGHPPTEEQLLASISPGELKRHCRRRTRGVEEMRRMISGLLQSMWDLTDTTGLHLVNCDSMRHVWEKQQKHLECLQDPAGVLLYTKVGTLQKGGKELDVLRCGRGSSSLESFHGHQCAFIPGWRCNAVHMQMYMLEGVSRWNMGRAKEAVDVEGASTLRSFDVRLMSHLNNLSRRVHGCALVSEFTPPGKPTSERIAVEYLLAQTNRGDLLLAPSRVPEVPSQVIEEEDEPDDTISMPDIVCQSAGDPPSAVEGDAEPGPLVTQVQVHVPEVPLQVIEEEDEPDDTISMPDIVCQSAGDPPSAVEGDAEPGPLVTHTSQCDSRGIVGWDAVDALSAYLVGLNRTITALSAKEEADIVHLYTSLHAMDQKPSSYTQKARKKARASGGPWRASRKPSGSAPGQQAAERLYMTHGQAAQDPEDHRVSECVCLRLAKEFEQSRNRPKDMNGKTLPIPQSIVSVYSHIRQLLEDSSVIVVQTTLALLPVNTTTVSAWLLRRDKRKDRNMLLQGTVLPQQLYLAKEPLPPINTLPAAPVQHAHEEMMFEEPENRQGEAFPRQRTLAANKPVVILPPPPPPQFPPQFGPAPFLQAPPFSYAPPFPHFPFPHAPPFPGEPPRKRLTKEKYHYTCKGCGQDKSKRTGHTQQKGRWYCPESGQTLDDWKWSSPPPKTTSKTSDQVLTASSFSDDGLANILQRQNDITSILVKQQKQSTLPQREIPVFSGDVLSYRPFIRAFEHIIENKTEGSADRLYFLDQYTSGLPRNLVRSCLHMSPERGYEKAKALLQEHYGDEFKICSAYMTKALEWPPIKAEDLNAFVIFLRSCCNAMEEMSYCNEINLSSNMKILIMKLPYRLRERWRSYVCDFQERHNRRPQFSDLVSLLERQVRIASDPVYGNIQDRPIRATERQQIKTKPKSIGNSFATSASILSTQQAKGNHLQVPCSLCCSNHTLENCSIFRKKKHREKLDFFKEKGFCFGCLTQGHISKHCRQKLICTVCSKQHPSLLHVENVEQRTNQREKGDASEAVKTVASLGTGAGTGAGNVLSVLPVRIKAGKGENTITVYAFLDPGSSATFCTERLMSQLNIKGRKTSILLRTMSSEKKVPTYVVSGLEISGLYGDNFTQLPDVFTQREMPVTADNIPSKQDLARWPYLQKVNIPEIDGNIELLIGMNASKIMEPWEIINSQGEGPYAVKTLVGWVVNGPLRGSESSIHNDCQSATINRISIANLEKLYCIAQIQERTRRAHGRH
ncbi:hypothetical protein N1851_002228 [Merluccius polli]|uniref:DUF6729 domain-containing protein n=1 Tax=Merluccius polli TaxID=89951 RepID=A0AA47NC30_MERPO|nr:hypothetical protein N1851_002228 [Merluccius polli]